MSLEAFSPLSRRERGHELMTKKVPCVCTSQLYHCAQTVPALAHGADAARCMRALIDAWRAPEACLLRV
jgi:hypothetical protein